MKKKISGGFTLIELMIVLVVGAIVILGIGSALVAGHGYLNKAWAKVNFQRDGYLAMLSLAHTIREGKSAVIENDGKTLRIYTDEGWFRFVYRDDTDLIYQFKANLPQTIIEDDVENLLFTLEDNKIGIDLNLREEDLKIHFVSTVLIRNYGK